MKWCHLQQHEWTQSHFAVHVKLMQCCKSTYTSKKKVFIPLASIWRRKWQPTPVFLPGESQGRRNLVGCRLWGHTESDTTEWLHFHFSLSCIGGTGNPLQCSCLENPRDRGAWWAVVYGVTQSRTWLKWLSSSSSVETMVSVPFRHILHILSGKFPGDPAAQSSWTCLGPRGFLVSTYGGI